MRLFCPLHSRSLWAFPPVFRVRHSFCLLSRPARWASTGFTRLLGTDLTIWNDVSSYCRQQCPHEAWETVAALACPPAMRLWNMRASRQQFRPVPEKYMNPLAFLSCRHEKEGTTAAVCPCPAPANGPDAPNGQYGGLSPCWCPPTVREQQGQEQQTGKHWGGIS